MLLSLRQRISRFMLHHRQWWTVTQVVFYVGSKILSVKRTVHTVWFGTTHLSEFIFDSGCGWTMHPKSQHPGVSVSITTNLLRCWRACSGRQFNQLELGQISSWNVWPRRPRNNRTSIQIWSHRITNVSSAQLNIYAKLGSIIPSATRYIPLPTQAGWKRT